MNLPASVVAAQYAKVGREVPAGLLDDPEVRRAGRVSAAATVAVKAATAERGGMNKTEARYADELEAQKRAGVIRSWRFEHISLLIGADCRYRPDFLVTLPDGRLQLREVKGYMQDDALVKIKAVAHEWGDVFEGVYVVRALGRTAQAEWSVERVPAGPAKG